MTETQKEIIRQIRDGIDNAREHGVVCGYPNAIVVDGKWMHWPYATYLAERPTVRTDDARSR